MKKFITKLYKSIIATIILIGICYVVLLLMGKLDAPNMKLFASLNAMYAFPIILGNMLLLNINSGIVTEGSGLVKKILKSIGLSMVILFASNLVLWVVIWGAPFADLFTERNIVFYLIGFCILIVGSILFHSIRHRIYYNRSI